MKSLIKVLALLALPLAATTAQANVSIAGGTQGHSASLQAGQFVATYEGYSTDLKQYQIEESRYLIGFEYEATETLSLIPSVGIARSELSGRDSVGESNVAIGKLGVRYAVTENFKIDAGYTMALSKHSYDVQTRVPVSELHPKGIKYTTESGERVSNFTLGITYTF